MNLIVVSVLYGSQSNLIEIVGGGTIAIVFFRLISSLAIFDILFYLLYAYFHIRFYSDILAENRISTSLLLMNRRQEDRPCRDDRGPRSAGQAGHQNLPGNGSVQKACALCTAGSFQRHGACKASGEQTGAAERSGTCDAASDSDSESSHAS